MESAGRTSPPSHDAPALLESKKRPRSVKVSSAHDSTSAMANTGAAAASSSSGSGDSVSTAHDAGVHARPHRAPPGTSRGLLAGGPSTAAPLLPFTSAATVDDGDGGEEPEFVESASESVSALIALMPQAIATLSDQARIGADGEPLDGRIPVLLASNVDLATFNALLSSETRPKVSLSYDAPSGSVHIYELPKDGHDPVMIKINALFDRYSGAQGGRRDPPSSDDFLSLGTTDVSLGPYGNRQPDGSFRAKTSVHAEPVLIVEVCHAQTLADGDARAQAWLLCDELKSHVQAVVIIKYWPRRYGEAFAAVAALYEQGGGPGAVARTANLVPPPGAVARAAAPVAAAALALPVAAAPAVAPLVYVPGVPVPPAPAVAAVAARRRAPNARLVAVTPIAPTRVVSFGTAPPWAGAAMECVRGLGTAPEGVGFPGVGLCNGAACSAVDIPGYVLRVPAARLYFGVPAGVQLPAGLKPNPLSPDPLNDFHMDLFAVLQVLSSVLPNY